MPVVRKIEPKTVRLVKKKRVAAYARVSMETELLMHSLSAQISHYSKFIQSNPEWEYAGVYADEGISGRGIKGRKEFIRLIEECEAGNVDLILVKSISRFARDTVDTLTITRRLREIGVDVYFERERIHSLSDEGELMLTLLASFAQQESMSTSDNVKWGIRKMFKEGRPNGHTAPYGYRWSGEKYVIIPEQGEVVKEIFTRYLAGESAHGIAKDLARRGITSRDGGLFNETSLKFIVTNYAYSGILILQKNYISDEHKRKRNKGELPMYVVEDMFEPLVSKKDVEKAINIRKKRAESMPNSNPEITKFSGKVKCGYCGCGVSRRTREKGIKVWNCNTKERKGKDMCCLKRIKESDLEKATEGIKNFTKITVFDEKVVISTEEGREIIWERK